MSHQSEKFDTHIKLISTDVGEGCKKTIKLQVSPEISAEYLSVAVNKLSKNVSLPGFRKGKVPKSYIMDKLSDHVREQWSDELAQHVSKKVIDSLNLRLVAPAVYSWETLSETEESVMEVVLETYPDIANMDIGRIKPKSAPKKKSISSSDVESKVKSYTYTLANWEDTNKITSSTRLSVSMLDGEQTLKDRRVLEEFEKPIRDALKPMSIGETKEITIKDKTLTVTLEKIEKMVDPENARELLLSRFKMDNIDDLKSEIRKRMEKNLDEEFIESCKSTIHKHLTGVLDFDVPQSILDSEIKARSEHLQNLSEKEKDSALKKITIESKEALRSFFLIEQLAIDYKIDLSSEQKNFLASQRNKTKHDDLAIKRMAAQLLSHEVMVFLIKRFGWLN